MRHLYFTLITIILAGCLDSNSSDTTAENSDNSGDQTVPDNKRYSGSIYQIANGCYQVRTADNQRVLDVFNNSYRFIDANQSSGISFHFQASKLGEYLLYDQNQHFLGSDNNQLIALANITSEMLEPMPETQVTITPAEWKLVADKDTADNSNFFLWNIQQQSWLNANGLTKSKKTAQPLQFQAGENCAQFPEADIATSGIIEKTTHDSGELWGYADAHEHIMANFGFGGRMTHGAAFHRYGISHALADCEKHHGPNGQYDLINLATGVNSAKQSTVTNANFSLANIITDNINLVPEYNHSTRGYPTMDDWDVHTTMTHQQLYYKWIERAYLGGLRLLVEYFETVEVVCEIYQRLIPVTADHASCNEMDHVDYQLQKMHELQDYIDAQNGGPGKGWFRLVYSPAEAREVIADGKLAVILGLEIENPFNCFTYAKPDHPLCTDDDIKQRLSEYHQKGIRAIFPAHKFNNGFAAGDGSSMSGALEVGDFINAGRFRDYDACSQVPGLFFGSHGEGSELSIFDQIRKLSPALADLYLKTVELFNLPQPPVYSAAEYHCQANGFTQAGRTLIYEMMKLGMIIDTAHMPRAALNNAIPWLLDNQYPAVNTHSGDPALTRLINGFTSGGLSSTCRDENGQSGIVRSFDKFVNEIDYATGLSRKGISYDFNGLAGYNRPRFGEHSPCSLKQADPLQYPFTSPAGDVVFDRLQVGERIYDFNQDGLANIGLMPDLIEEARRAGASEESMNLLFKSAEAYIQRWEIMEARSNKIQPLEDNISETADMPVTYQQLNIFIANIIKWLSPILGFILF